jgi:hypothetical protein
VQTSSEHTQLTMLGPPQLPSVSIFAFPETSVPDFPNAELQLLFGEDGIGCRPAGLTLAHGGGDIHLAPELGRSGDIKQTVIKICVNWVSSFHSLLISRDYATARRSTTSSLRAVHSHSS